jgi:hypothetical protein
MQTGTSFLGWILLGIFMARQKEAAPSKLSRLGRIQKSILGSGLLILSLVVLFAPLNIIVSNGGLRDGPMSPATWLVVTTSGLLFVGANAVAMRLLGELAKPNAPPEEAAVLGSPSPTLINSVTSPVESASTFQDHQK